jgi:glucan phosphoethanolaminetransferase (alkaline phosphatase superfamily)
MLDTVFNLPAHALVVHVVVVLLPLAAVGAVAIAVVPSLRRRFGLLVAALTVVSVAAVPVATHSGQRMFDRRLQVLGPNDATEIGLIEEHRTLGHELWPWAVLLLVGVLIVVIVPWFARRRDGRPARWTRWVAPLGIAVVLVGAVLSTVQVVRIGHAGSRAVWDRAVNAGAPR